MIVVLMGYMASGKSTIGEVLANKLHFKFVDLDNYIKNCENRSIKEIFKESGEIYFRKKETFYLSELLNTNEKIVLALGGGTPSYGQNMELILSNTNVKSFYLKVSLSKLVQRLENETTKRPLIAHLKTKEELIEFVGKHMFERLQFYKEAHYSIDSDSASIEDIVEDIIFKLF